MHWACPNLTFGFCFRVSVVRIAFAPDEGGAEKSGEDNERHQSVTLGLSLSLNRKVRLISERIHNDLLKVKETLGKHPSRKGWTSDDEEVI
jgi:hypothetical protein